MSTSDQSQPSNGRTFVELLRTANPWLTALGMLSAALIVGGVIASWTGIDTLGHYGAVLGQIPEFDAAAALTATGFAAITVGLFVGAAWLIVNAVAWTRDSNRSAHR